MYDVWMIVACNFTSKWLRPLLHGYFVISLWTERKVCAFSCDSVFVVIFLVEGKKGVCIFLWQCVCWILSLTWESRNLTVDLCDAIVLQHGWSEAITRNVRFWWVCTRSIALLTSCWYTTGGDIIRAISAASGETVNNCPVFCLAIPRHAFMDCFLFGFLVVAIDERR